MVCQVMIHALLAFVLALASRDPVIELPPRGAGLGTSVARTGGILRADGIVGLLIDLAGVCSLCILANVLPSKLL